MLGIGVARRSKYNHDSKPAENHHSFTNLQSIPQGAPTREILSTRLKEVAHHFGLSTLGLPKMICTSYPGPGPERQYRPGPYAT